MGFTGGFTSGVAGPAGAQGPQGNPGPDGPAGVYIVDEPFVQPAVDATADVRFQDATPHPPVGSFIGGAAGSYEVTANQGGGIFTLRLLEMRNTAPGGTVPALSALGQSGPKAGGKLVDAGVGQTVGAVQITIGDYVIPENSSASYRAEIHGVRSTGVKGMIIKSLHAHRPTGQATVGDSQNTTRNNEISHFGVIMSFQLSTNTPSVAIIGAIGQTDTWYVSIFEEARVAYE